MELTDSPQIGPISFAFAHPRSSLGVAWVADIPATPSGDSFIPSLSHCLNAIIKRAFQIPLSMHMRIIWWVLLPPPHPILLVLFGSSFSFLEKEHPLEVRENMVNKIATFLSLPFPCGGRFVLLCRDCDGMGCQKHLQEANEPTNGTNSDIDYIIIINGEASEFVI